MDFKTIHEEQKRPLEYKIEQAVKAIESGFNVSKHNCALAFSGGKDSTVLWALVSYLSEAGNNEGKSSGKI